jgi:L-aminopeptidase/D-esterase-like protein
VATNAKLSKAQTLKVAQMAQDGLARSIFPSHLPNDGDTIFALATGQLPMSGEPDVGRIGGLAAEMISDAIERAVRNARGLPGYPAAAEIR